MSTPQPVVVILGAGKIGSAINFLLKKKGIKPNLWDRDPKKAPRLKPLADLISQADVLFLCIPSWVLPEAIASFRALLKPHTIVITLSKGIHKKEKSTVDALLKKYLPPSQSFALLSGPMLAEELLAGCMGMAVVATKTPSVFKKVSALFHETPLLVEPSFDLRGVALSGVLKNIYAVALGITEGLRWGANQKGWLTTKILEEMRGITIFFGGKEATVLGTAGLGDLLATGYSPYSCNRRAGEALLKREPLPKSEGMIALASILHALKKKKNRFPLLQALKEIIIKKHDAKTVFERFVAKQRP